LRIFSPEPALILAFLAAMLAYRPGLFATFSCLFHRLNNHFAT
jgi:hypothetical protein